MKVWVTSAPARANSLASCFTPSGSWIKEVLNQSRRKIYKEPQRKLPGSNLQPWRILSSQEWPHSFHLQRSPHLVQGAPRCPEGREGEYSHTFNFYTKPSWLLLPALLSPCPGLVPSTSAGQALSTVLMKTRFEEKSAPGPDRWCSYLVTRWDTQTLVHSPTQLIYIGIFFVELVLLRQYPLKTPTSIPKINLFLF